MKCPRDENRLIPQTYEDSIVVDICPKCKGMLLDRGELVKIEETIERDYSEELARIPDLAGNAFERARQRSDRDISCPRCGSDMETREYAYCSQVMINTCPSCGSIWLDRGEIEALEVFYERSREESKALRISFLRGLTGKR